MKQTAHPGACRSDQTQKGAVIKAGKGPVFRGPSLNLVPILLDALFGSGNLGKALRAPGQSVFESGAGQTGDIIEPATSPAGNPLADLAKVDLRDIFGIPTRGDWRNGLHQGSLVGRLALGSIEAAKACGAYRAADPGYPPASISLTSASHSAAREVVGRRRPARRYQ